GKHREIGIVERDDRALVDVGADEGDLAEDLEEVKISARKVVHPRRLAAIAAIPGAHVDRRPVAQTYKREAAVVFHFRLACWIFGERPITRRHDAATDDANHDRVTPGRRHVDT